jgi:hypothetical protein
MLLSAWSMRNDSGVFRFPADHRSSYEDTRASNAPARSRAACSPGLTRSASSRSAQAGLAGRFFAARLARANEAAKTKTTTTRHCRGLQRMFTDRTSTHESPFVRRREAAADGRGGRRESAPEESWEPKCLGEEQGDRGSPRLRRRRAPVVRANGRPRPSDRRHRETGCSTVGDRRYRGRRSWLGGRATVRLAYDTTDCRAPVQQLNLRNVDTARRARRTRARRRSSRQMARRSLRKFLCTPEGSDRDRGRKPTLSTPQRMPLGRLEGLQVIQMPPRR